MNLYFDTEFTGLVPGTTLISIGMISEDDKRFYAEFTDYNKDLCDEWITKNVIDNLMLEDKEALYTEKTYDTLYVKGDSNYICEALRKWLEGFDEKTQGRIQLVSDVCHYDMVLLCNLFGGAFKIPDNVNPACYDICQDLMNYFASDTSGDYYNCEDGTMEKAFDSSRERFLEKVLKVKISSETKHNAMFDAYIIKSIYEGLRRDK